MEQLDALVSQCRNLARMEDGPTKEGLKSVAFEMLREYEVEKKITRDFRLMLETIVQGGQPPHESRNP